MSMAVKFGRFLRVIDESKTMVSITNTAMWVVIVKVALAPTFTVEELGAFFVALLAYSGKKFMNSKKPDIDTDQSKKIDSLERDIRIVQENMAEIKDKAGIAALTNTLRKQ